MKGKHFYPKKKNRFTRTIYLSLIFCVIIFLVYFFKDKAKDINSIDTSNIQLEAQNNENIEKIASEEKANQVLEKEQHENNNRREKEQQEIEKSIKDLFENLKKLNKKNIKKYLDFAKLLNSVDEMIIKQNDEELEKALFSNLLYKIKNIDIEGKKAKVEMEVINKDYKEIYTKWMKEILKEKNENKKIDEKIAMKILKTIVKKEKQTKKVSKEITLNKKNNYWEIVVNVNLRDLVFPGINIVDSILSNNN